MTQSERIAAWVVDGPVFRPWMSRLSAPQRQLLRSSVTRSFLHYCRFIAILAFPVAVSLICLRFFGNSLEHVRPILNDLLIIALQLVAFFAVLTSMAVYAPGSSQIYRTRPVSRRFLFWTQYFSGAVATSVSTGVILVLSILLLTAIYGWKPVLGAGFVAAASFPKQMLSFFTTFWLVYSFFLLAVSWIRALSALFIPGILAIDVGLHYGPKILFVYLTPANMHHPPPYAEALIPIAISLVLAVLAERLLARRET